MDLDTGDNHRLLAGRNAAHGFANRLGQNFGIAGGRFARGRVGAVGNQAHHVARQLDIARPPVAHHRRQHPVDLAEGRVRVVQFRLGAADAAEHLGLRMEVFHAVVQERIIEPLAQPRRAANDHHRRLLRIGPRDRIAQTQAAHAIRDAHRADAVEPGVGVGRETGAVFARATDQLDRALLDHHVERQHVIAGYAEDVAHPEILKPANQVVADRHAPDGRLMLGQSSRGGRSWLVLGRRHIELLSMECWGNRGTGAMPTLAVGMWWFSRVLDMPTASVGMAPNIIRLITGQ